MLNTASYRYGWKNANFNEFYKFISKVNWNEILDLNVKEKWAFFKDNLKSGMDMFIPKISFKCP